MIKFRLCFTKGEAVRWLSHLDLSRAWSRVFVRSELPLQYSEGFSPHPKIAFGPALPLGVSGRAEYMDVSMTELLDAKSVIASLNRSAPRGLEVSAGMLLPEGVKVKSLTAVVTTADYLFTVPLERRACLDEALTEVEIIDKKVGDHNISVTVRAPIRFKSLAAISEPQADIRIPWRGARVDRLGLWVNVNERFLDPIEWVDETVDKGL